MTLNGDKLPCYKYMELKIYTDNIKIIDSLLIFIGEFKKKLYYDFAMTNLGPICQFCEVEDIHSTHNLLLY